MQRFGNFVPAHPRNRCMRASANKRYHGTTVYSRGVCQKRPGSALTVRQRSRVIDKWPKQALDRTHRSAQLPHGRMLLLAVSFPKIWNRRNRRNLREKMRKPDLSGTNMDANREVAALHCSELCLANILNEPTESDSRRGTGTTKRRTL